MKSNEMKQALYQIASLQQGYFTAKQAKEVGYSDSRFPYHVNAGHWLHEGRGIYRLAHYPSSERPDLVYWSLWSSNREGIVQGAFSHETALAIHDLSDAMPAKYHLTVPKNFRRYHDYPDNLILHFNNLSKKEVIEFEGYKVTTPEQTIKDVIKDECISEELVIQAITDGLSHGIITTKTLNKIGDELKTDRTTRILNIIEKK